MELFEQIRRSHAAGRSIRELAKEFGIHRRMVRQALASAVTAGEEESGAGATEAGTGEGVH